MATLTNLGFETAGASPGLAGSWTTATTGAGAVYPDLSGGGGEAPRPYESFEAGWGNDDYLTTLDPLSVVLADFNTGADTTAYESFEIEWGNDAYLFALGSAIAASFTGGANHESFDAGWGNDDYLTTLDTTIAASFTGGGAYESFEAGWGNDDYLTALDTTTACSFDEGATAYETFAGLIAPFAFSVSSNTFQAAAHPLSNGNRVVFTGPGLSAEITVGLTYYVINKTTDTFQVSKTLGGVAIAVSDNASTTARCKGDPAVYWTEDYDA
jgi:hypothetical protein